MRRTAIFIVAMFLAYSTYRFHVSSRNKDSIKTQSEGRVVSDSERKTGTSVNTLQYQQVPEERGQNPSVAQSAPSGNSGGGFKNPPKSVSSAPIDRFVEESASRRRDAKTVAEDGSKGVSDSGGIVIQPKDAKGAVFALYQAILWREPDRVGGAAAVEAFTRIGWKTYIENAKNMITSTEFFEQIAPNHSAEDIINRMYAIFLNRCASTHEMQDHMGSLRDNETGNITGSILNKAIDENKQKIFEGGYQVNSCSSLQL